jgi:iron(III) transport system substrate-binding protein
MRYFYHREPRRMGRRWTRRHLLRRVLWGSAAAAFLAACGAGKEEGRATTPGAGALGRVATTSAPPTVAATLPEWEQTLAAAKREGKVVVNTFTGEAYRRVLPNFTRAYPEIKLEHTSLEAVDFAPRVTQERAAGVYTWDIVLFPTSTAFQVLKPAGVWDPIRPAIILPEVKDDKVWRDGFEAGFLDRDKNLCYGYTLVRGGGVWVNTDQVKEGEIRGFTDLLNPKWKGKIAVSDPRTIGSTFWPLTVARLKHGDDIMKPFLIDQEPVLSRDRNQLTEFVIRGRYPIGVGLNDQVVKDFQRQGVGKNVKRIFLDDLQYQSSGAIWLVNKAPHPNAAKVFINWFLTKDVQAIWAKELETNSRRLDVEPGDPDLLVPMGVKLLQIDAEEILPEVVKTQDIAKQLIR